MKEKPGLQRETYGRSARPGHDRRPRGQAAPIDVDRRRGREGEPAPSAGFLPADRVWRARTYRGSGDEGANGWGFGCGVFWGEEWMGGWWKGKKVGHAGEPTKR
jgi:hypothetical protein